jgi:hypothetical protein
MNPVVVDANGHLSTATSSARFKKATVKEQASQIQKVSAELELQKPPAQTVVNSQVNAITTNKMKGNKHMKTMTKFIYAAFAVVALATGAVTANGALNDLYASVNGAANNGGGFIYEYTPGWGAKHLCFGPFSPPWGGL